MMPARTYVLLAAAIGAGLVAAVLTRSVLRPSQAAEHADYYCYALRTAWACAYSRSECEARLAREPPRDIQTQCQAHHDEVLTP
jgi:hypothetical protein